MNKELKKIKNIIGYTLALPYLVGATKILCDYIAKLEERIEKLEKKKGD